MYSEYQKVELEKEYLFNKYITIKRKTDLSRGIGLSERQVKIWFQNRRAKERKEKRKRDAGLEKVLNSSVGSTCAKIEADVPDGIKMEKTHAPAAEFMTQATQAM